MLKSCFASYLGTPQPSPVDVLKLIITLPNPLPTCTSVPWLPQQSPTTWVAENSAGGQKPQIGVWAGWCLLETLREPPSTVISWLQVAARVPWLVDASV